ncbi:TPA: hypothetical protein ACUB7D_000781 [Serratia marcescens]
MMTSQQQKARSGFPERASLNMAPLTGLELYLYLLLLLALFKLNIFLPTYLPSLLFSCGKNVN